MTTKAITPLRQRMIEDMNGMSRSLLKKGGRRRSPQAARLEVANRKPRARRSTP